jgi:hypothetical protein
VQVLSFLQVAKQAIESELVALFLELPDLNPKQLVE